QILIVGTKSENEEGVRLQDIGAVAAQETASEDGPVALIATGLGTTPVAASQIAVGARLGSYRFDRYRASDPEAPPRPGEKAPMTVVTPTAGDAAAAWERQGEALADSVAFA